MLHIRAIKPQAAPFLVATTAAERYAASGLVTTSMVYCCCNLYAQKQGRRSKALAKT